MKVHAQLPVLFGIKLYLATCSSFSSSCDHIMVGPYWFWGGRQRNWNSLAEVAFKFQLWMYPPTPTKLHMGYLVDVIYVIK